MRRMASSDGNICAREDAGLRPRKRPRHEASTEGTVFLVAVVGVQTYLTQPKYADAVLNGKYAHFLQIACQEQKVFQLKHLSIGNMG